MVRLHRQKASSFIVNHLPDTYSLDNIRVVKLLKQRDLSNGSAGYTLCLTWRDQETEMGM